MDKWYIGIDGGGTKTAFAIAGEDGIPAASFQYAGCSHTSIGIDAVVALIADGVLRCLKEVNASPETCAGICLGLSCYGEDPNADTAMRQGLADLLTPIPVHVVNDVEVGWAGALEGKPGIHIVAGTGSIAFGKNVQGSCARCGGWNEFFGDEGSCYWIGRKAMGLFSKESDGRAPRGALYEIVRNGLNIQQDMDFINAVIQEIAPYRDKVAAFQKYACEAALAGDTEAVKLYDRAALELAAMVLPLKQSLKFTDAVTEVSYSGGLFQTGALILEPLAKYLLEMGCMLIAPKKTPVEGALILAIQKFSRR